jgi:hypothetical protein
MNARQPESRIDRWLWALLGALVAGAAVMTAQSPSVPATSPAAAVAGQTPPTNLDAFMARVLERRDENWRRLHDYILSETESFSIDGPGKLPLNGFKREYSWYVREGYLVRSPIRIDGVTTPEAERRQYEEKWLQQEKAREERARKKAKSSDAGPAPAGQGPDKGEVPSLDQFVDQRGEPRFISEAYFLQFTFEPGNYYLAGREQYEGRNVLRVEYYPTGLFGDHGGKAGRQPAGTAKAGRGRGNTAQVDEDEIERKMNKVAMVTLWIDPAEFQIVKYTFDNTDFGFLPGRWLVRVGDVSASMTMSRVLGGVWLPGQITMHAQLRFASGDFGFRYTRSFYDYKKAEVGARVRVIGAGRP